MLTLRRLRTTRAKPPSRASRIELTKPPTDSIFFGASSFVEFGSFILPLHSGCEMLSINYLTLGKVSALACLVQ
jgi:hypothetical protein